MEIALNGKIEKRMQAGMGQWVWEGLKSIHRPVGAKTLDAVKRRVRAGMGRCQSGFCSPLVIEILARELGIPEEEVRKRDNKSFMLSKK